MHPILDPTLCIWERAIVEGTIAAAEIAQIISPILLKPIPNEHQRSDITQANSYKANTKRLDGWLKNFTIYERQRNWL